MYISSAVCRFVRWSFMALAALVAVPAVAHAQGSIAGVVKDVSGAVLPGVTVEAASPALIEKTRSVVSDGAGQYKIVDLRPGTYSVTFTLPGFSTVKRDGIELTGSFTATVNGDMKVGAVAETITVTGETPIVDIQSTKVERVLSKEVIDSLPSNKNYQTLMTLIPGMGGPIAGVGNGQDVGGSSGEAQIQFAIHGTRGNDQRFTVNGVPFAEGNGSTHALGMNVMSMQEMAIGTGAADATLGQGGVRLNYVPKAGGNTFSGGMYVSGSNSSLQSDNITQDLKTRGLPSVNKMKTLWDVAPTFGGPIVKDKLWFFTSFRRQVTDNYLAGRYVNANLKSPDLATSFRYAPDLSQQMTGGVQGRWAGARVTWQANAKNKIGISYDANTNCLCANQGGTYSPEAGRRDNFYKMDYLNIDWSSPLTSRLLVDASIIQHPGNYRVSNPNEAIPGFIQVTDNAPPASYLGVTQYRGAQNRTENQFPTFNSRASVSYVTGAHSLNVGFTFGNGQNRSETYRDVPLSYTFTGGKPTGLTQYAFNATTPVIVDARLDAEVGLWVQDRFTSKRLTLTGALRFDYLKTSGAAVTLVGATDYFPGRADISFPETQIISWKDVTPRMGAVYDLFGNGKTALKTSLNRYVVNQGAGGPGNPAALYVSSATRSWTDNGNFVVDCDLSSPLANGTNGDTCGAFTGNNVNFGKAVSGTTIDPAINNGWGARGYNWEFSGEIQQQLLPRVSLDVAYFRRWYGNFLVTDNRAVSAADYASFSVTAPTDSRLPTSGQPISGFININQNAATRPTDNFQTFASAYGNQIEHWNGVDVNVNARLARGIFLSGGTSTGRTSTDNCDILDDVPEASIGNAVTATAGPAGNVAYCHVDTAFLTQIKGLGSYVVPKIAVQISATFQNRPGPERLASYVVVPSQTSLNRNFVGANNLAVNIVAPGTTYGERVNQIDLRLSKILTFGRTRSNVSVDLFNVTNANAVLTESNNYSNWLTPSATVTGRLVKFTAQFDF